MTALNRDVFRTNRAYRIDRMRVGQQYACLAIEKCVFAGKNFISIVLPTRYGKSHVIRATAGQLVSTGHACCALVLSPNTTLRDQMTNPDKMRGFIDLLEPTFDVSGKVYTIKNAVANPGANGEWFLSGNIQLIQRNLDLFGQWVNSRVARTGKTVLVYADEAHTGSVKNKWGEVVRVLAANGATVILLTATPYRADGDMIHGFQTVVVSEEDYIKYVTSNGSLPELTKVSVFEGSKRLVKLLPVYEYTLKQAWEEDPIPVAKIEWLPFSVNIEEYFKKENVVLADMKPSVVRGILGKVVRDPTVIRCGVQNMVDRLRELKKKDPDISAIVFSGNDREDDAEYDSHARTIEAMIKMLAPELRVVVSTTSSDEENDDKLESYCAGIGDVLIVKQRASVGLDVARLKVALDLSPVRTRAAFLQRLMRIATVYKGFYGIMVAPDEPIGAALFESLVAQEGGEATVADMEKTDEYEVTKKESDQKELFSVHGTGGADFGDSDQNWADHGMMAKVEAFLSFFPQVVGLVSRAQIATQIEASQMDLKVPASLATKELDTNLQIFTARKSITGRMSEIIRRDRMGRGIGPDSEESYGITASKQYKKLYKIAGVTHMPIEKQANLTTLAMLNQSSIEMLADLGGGDKDE